MTCVAGSGAGSLRRQRSGVDISSWYVKTTALLVAFFEDVFIRIVNTAAGETKGRFILLSYAEMHPSLVIWI